MSNNLPAVVQAAVKNQEIVLKDVRLILPTESYGQLLGPYDKVTIEVVRISVDPKDKEVYNEGKEKALSKIGLEKLAIAVGIQWDPVNTSITLSTDYKSIAKATGRMKKANGEWISCTETKTIDCKLYEEEQLDVVTNNAEKGNFAKILKWKKTDSGKSYPVFEPWQNETEKQQGIIKELNKIVRQKRKFKDELAMTGAKERVIRYFLAIKGTYKIEELQKPFAIPRIITDTSAMLENPDLRKYAVEQMTGAVSSIFEESNGMQKIKNVTPEVKEITNGSDHTDNEPDPPPPAKEPETISKLSNPIVKKMHDEMLSLLENELISPDEKTKILAWSKLPEKQTAENIKTMTDWIQRKIAEREEPDQGDLLI